MLQTRAKMKSSVGKSQGDPAALAIYAISIIPMILMLLEIIVNIQNNKTKLVAYDLSAVAGCISEKKKKNDRIT